MVAGIILLVIVAGLLLLVWGLARMAAPYNAADQAANDEEQMEDLRKQAEERTRKWRS